ncbi:hypothetical protein GIB67_026407, partial [Kingdonia uniflora]
SYDNWEVYALADIGLGKNKLEGPIPRTMEMMANLGLLSLKRNLISGSIPSSLDLSFNELQGSLPTEIGDRHVEKSFFWCDPKHDWELHLFRNHNISNNMLDGSIPESMGDITYLKVLDLSLNNISGKIPDCLEKHQRLNNLNFSYNRLAGEVQSMQSFKSYGRRSFMGNVDLCGSSALTGLPSCEMLLMHKRRKSGRRVNLLVAIRVGSRLVCIVIVVVYIRRCYPKKATFSKYTVVQVGCHAKINPATPLNKVCALSCGISTDLLN